MKKYAVYFSFLNIVRASQEEVVKLQMIWAGLIGPVVASTFVASDDRTALAVSIGGFVIDKLISCLYFEEKQ